MLEFNQLRFANSTRVSLRRVNSIAMSVLHQSVYNQRPSHAQHALVEHRAHVQREASEAGVGPHRRPTCSGHVEQQASSGDGDRRGGFPLCGL